MFLYATVTQILCLAVVLTVIGRGALILLPKSIQTLGGGFFAPIFCSGYFGTIVSCLWLAKTV